ncbi:hypothetical protein CVT26_007959 [Gymnopilus dilepis]|uniref:BZIP domain-containing protein n=1 Tax=Gymnopilus dilepis TaxID=231916 RepID=A0A409W7H6_9AGAR|nr:hypothetical protein CVT26_007959 [Gymnopilus dilepis]
MTRGRKKDLTIPPTRSLLQQRDYRARKANYVATLEERCRKAEEENVQLRNELVQLRAHLTNSAVILPETPARLISPWRLQAEASKELMQALTAASPSTSNNAGQRTNHGRETQATSQSSEEIRTVSSHGSNSQTPISFGRKRLFRDDSPPFQPPPRRTSTPLSSPSPVQESECCGGLVDCDRLNSDGVIEDESDEEHGMGGTRIRLSGLRSTSMSEHRG